MVGQRWFWMQMKGWMMIQMRYLVWPEGDRQYQRGLAPEERRTSSPVTPHI